MKDVMILTGAGQIGDSACGSQEGTAVTTIF